MSRRVVPNPTGENGYEEYLLAVDVLQTPAYVAFAEWRGYRETAKEGSPRPPVDIDGNPRPAPKPPAGLSLQSSELEVRRHAARFFAEPLRLIKIGNRKRVFEPRTTIDSGTLFPELAQFRNLVRLATDAAYVAFADGSSRLGTEILVEALSMGHRIQMGTLIQALVGLSCEGTVLAAFERHLGSLSLPDCRTIDAAVGELLAGPVTLVGAIHGERKHIENSMQKLLDGDPTKLGEDEEGSKWIRRMTPAQRAEAKRALSQRLEAMFDPALARLAGPEEGWYRDFPDVEEAEGSELEGAAPMRNLQELLAFVDSVAPPIRGVVNSTGRSRTQMRLLRLNARILAHKWREGALPATLDKVASREEIADPLSAGEFRYVLTESGGYRVFSPGTPELGEVDLRYRRPQREEPGSKEP